MSTAVSIVRTLLGLLFDHTIGNIVRMIPIIRLPKLERGPVSRGFLALLLGILFFGLTMLFSASYSSAYATSGKLYSIIKPQVMIAIVGLFFMWVLSNINYRTLRLMSESLYIITVVLLILTLLSPEDTNGTYRWVYLPGGASFQPSELAKFSLMLWTADMLDRDYDKKNRLWYGAIKPALPLLLILVIQGSVWINFSFPALLHNNLYFLAYLIVSAIMMGANIDYAIVISSRYLRLKEEMPYKEAMIEALNQAFPTVVTSGTILAAAGMSIGFLSSENTVASIGICLGRGTLISMVLVMCVLPQILLLGDSLVEKTSFTIGHHAAPQHLQGAMRVNGHVRGYINGYVDAEIHGRVNGTVSASIDIGNVQMEEAPAQTAPAADLHGEEGSDEKT